MTGGLIHADNFTRAYRNYHFFHFMIFEMMDADPGMRHSGQQMDYADSFLQAKIALMSGWRPK